MTSIALPRAPRRFAGLLWTLELVTGPEVEPITLAQMKNSLRCYDSVTSDDEDITDLITAAREWVEDYTGRVLVDQTWLLTIDNKAGTYTDEDNQVVGTTVISAADIMLHRSPVLAITSFVSVDGDGDETAVDATTYDLCEATSKWPRIGLTDGAALGTGVFKIEFRAGFADQTGSPQDDVSVIPKRFIQAMKLWAKAYYDADPATMQTLIDAAKNLIKSERIELGMA